jgi:hypothetical protein
MRGSGILRTSHLRSSPKLLTLGLAGHLRLGGVVWAQQFLKALHRRDLRLRLLPEGQTLQYLVELFLGVCVHQEHDGRTTDRVPSGHHFALRLQLRQGLHRREDRTLYELGQLIYGKERSVLVRFIFTRYSGIPKRMIAPAWVAEDRGITGLYVLPLFSRVRGIGIMRTSPY